MEGQANESAYTVKVQDFGSSSSFHVTLNTRSSLRDFKCIISQTHPRRPAPSCQKLVAAGKILVDEAEVVWDVLKAKGATQDLVPPVHLLITEPPRPAQASLDPSNPASTPPRAIPAAAGTSTAAGATVRQPSSYALRSDSTGSSPSSLVASPRLGAIRPAPESAVESALAAATAATPSLTMDQGVSGTESHAGESAERPVSGPSPGPFGHYSHDESWIANTTTHARNPPPAAVTKVPMHPIMAAAYSAAYAELTRGAGAPHAEPAPVIQPAVLPLYMPGVSHPTMMWPGVALPSPGHGVVPGAIPEPLVAHLRRHFRGTPGADRRVRLMIHRHRAPDADDPAMGDAARAERRGAGNGAMRGVGGAPVRIFRLDIIVDPRRVLQFAAFLAFAYFMLPFRRFLVIFAMSLLYALNVHAAVHRWLGGLLDARVVGPAAPAEQEPHQGQGQQAEAQGAGAEGGGGGGGDGGGGGHAVARGAPLDRLREAMEGALRQRRAPPRGGAAQTPPGVADAPEPAAGGAGNELGAAQGGGGGAGAPGEAERAEAAPRGMVVDAAHGAIAIARAASLIVLSFVLSLLPGFEQNAADAEAIAAAQDGLNAQGGFPLAA